MDTCCVSLSTELSLQRKGKQRQSSEIPAMERWRQEDLPVSQASQMWHHLKAQGEGTVDCVTQETACYTNTETWV